MNNLPDDLLRIILNLTKKSAIFNCVRVCKLWNSLAKEVIRNKRLIFINNINYPLIDRDIIAIDRDLYINDKILFPNLRFIKGDLILNYKSDVYPNEYTDCNFIPKLRNIQGSMHVFSRSINEAYSNFIGFKGLSNLRYVGNQVTLGNNPNLYILNDFINLKFVGAMINLINCKNLVSYNFPSLEHCKLIFSYGSRISQCIDKRYNPEYSN